MKYLTIIISILLINISIHAQDNEKTYKVLASCGPCNFAMSSKTGCTLAIQYGGKKYWVDGSTLEDHGDEHDPEGGMCQKVRKAEVKGSFKKDRFQATSFVIIPKREKKKKKK